MYIYILVNQLMRLLMKLEIDSRRPSATFSDPPRFTSNEMYPFSTTKEYVCLALW